MHLLRIAWSSLFASGAWSRPALARSPVGPTAILLTIAAMAAPFAAAAQSRPVPDTFLGTTANMTPAGVSLKIDVVDWSDEDARGAVIAALQGENVADALTELPTVGYLWVDESPVGYALKYAHRVSTDAGERVTLVTTPVLGQYGLEDWQPTGATASEAYEYSVVELDIGEDGGRGTVSLAADVAFDAEQAIVTLDWGESEPLLTDVVRAEPPYWAKDG